MELYHYRPISSALKEITEGTLHFATREELNDPLEGYVSVFWQGDRPAWEGLFQNYVCSVHKAVMLYLLQGDEQALRHQSLVVDVHQFDEVPLGEIWKKLGDQFLQEPLVQALAEAYGASDWRVEAEELQLLLCLVHARALSLCVQEDMDRGAIPRDQAEPLLQNLKRIQPPTLPAGWTEALPEAQRTIAMQALRNGLEDLQELRCLRQDLGDDEPHPGTPEARRNFYSIVVDFPKLYVAQLQDLVYPESYVVCFSGKNDDSAMWGNYADCHRGVCLVYDAEALTAAFPGGVKPVQYGGERLERNFFESFGRLTRSQITAWLTGTAGLSRCYGAIADVETWRARYWEVFEAKTYRKLPTWAHEDERRLALNNTFYEYDDPKSRDRAYPPQALQGVIFGIHTSLSDKKQVVEALLGRGEAMRDIAFYQAEFDDAAQKLRIRQKIGWNLQEFSRRD